MKLTKFTFFKNTPLIDFQNTIHFNSNQERDDFFLKGRHYPTLETEQENYNFIRDRSTVYINAKYKDMSGVNYLTFKSDFESTRYYAYVIEYSYINDDVVKVDFIVDGIMTFTQGHVLETLPNLNISRQHLSRTRYDALATELKNNSDVLKTDTKFYFKTDKMIFNDLIVLMQSSVDLEGNFGTVDEPKMETSSGRQYDSVTSPLNLYACSIDDFNRFMRKISKYSWIAQNITSLSLIPRVFMEENMTKINFDSNESLSGVNYLYKITGRKTQKQALNSDLDKVSKTMNELYTIFGLDPKEDKHLLRSEYGTIEIYNYSGDSLLVDLGQLNENLGLKLVGDIITGYHNELKIYIDRYRSVGIGNGSYVNDSITFDTFDDMPMLIDNYQLGMAKTANQRKLTESKLLTNQVGTIMDNNADIKDRFVNAVSLASNLSPTSLFGKFTDEMDYYKKQKAEQLDLALETPSITNQSTGNSFNIANQNFGIHIKYSKPTLNELRKIKKYYKLFGYEVNEKSEKLGLVNSMSICNYLQFSGSWTIKGTDVSIIEMMKAQFENGVRFWHNNGTPNPMTQDVINNKIVK